MPAHNHADLMMQYAHDAQETDAPWERWQYQADCGQWFECFSHPAFNEDMKYRRKPKTIVINGIEVPEPMRVAPQKGKAYFLVSIVSPALTEPYYWDDDNRDKKWLDSGICHLTEEAARKHAEALISFTKVQQ